MVCYRLVLLRTIKHRILSLTIASLLATTAFSEPIHDAAENGRLAGVQAELDKGADVHAKDERGSNPLHYAALKGHRITGRNRPLNQAL